MTQIRNPYVVRVASGHPGFVDHQVLSTIDGLRNLAAELRAAVDDRKPEDAALLERQLLSVYATEAYGRSDRVYLSFHVAPDLRPYHQESFRSRHRMAMIWMPMLTLIGFALVGVRATLAWLLP